MPARSGRIAFDDASFQIEPHQCPGGWSCLGNIVVAWAAFLGLRAGFGGRRFCDRAWRSRSALRIRAVRCPADRARRRTGVGTGRSFSADHAALRGAGVLMGCGGRLQMMLFGAAYAVILALLLASSRGKAPGTWQDYAALLAVWLPVEFRWMYRLFPYPQPLTHTLTILMALSTGVAAFVLLRRMAGVGYALDWRRGFAFHTGFNFLVFGNCHPARTQGRFPSLAAGTAGDPRYFRVRTSGHGPVRSRDLALYSLARGVFVSRPASECALKELSERMGWLDRGVAGFWVLAHLARAVSELEIRLPRSDRGVFRERVDENGIACSRRADSRRCRHSMAHPVSLIGNRGKELRGESPPPLAKPQLCKDKR